jgi:hypothetical protein
VREECQHGDISSDVDVRGEFVHARYEDAPANLPPENDNASERPNGPSGASAKRGA